MVPRVQSIVDSFVDERARLERFARSLSAEDLARAVPGSTWMVKDFIAHAATLDAAYVGWFIALARDADPGNHRGTPGFDVDRFNESAVAERRGRSVEDILAEGRHAACPPDQRHAAILGRTARFHHPLRR